MEYLIVNIEITEPLPVITLEAEEAGVAVLVRRKGVPVCFWMEALPKHAVLGAQDLAYRISEKAGEKLLSESIREALVYTPMTASLPSLTIAICTKDRTALLARCLQSIQALLTKASDLSWEILVVDNGPSDGQTRELVDNQPSVRYVCEPRPGLDFARNRALREACGTLIAFLDDDVMVDAGWLAGLEEAWRENPDAAAFTGLVLPAALQTEAQILFEQRGGFRRGFNKVRYHGQRWPDNPLYPCGAGIFGAGANMAFRRDVLLELGGFDEALDTGAPLPGGGDLDMFYRVIRAGYPLVYEPRFLVFHLHRRDREGLRRQYRSWGLGFMAFLDKSYRTDPEMRRRFIRMVKWWFKDQARQFGKSVCGRHELPPRMVFAEWWGGVVGLWGEYRRSERRVAQIRMQHAATAEADAEAQMEVV